MFSKTMRQKKVKPIGSLVRQVIQTGPHHDSWRKSMVLHAWHHAFPFTQNHVEQLTIKKHTAYIKFNTHMLTQALRSHGTTALTEKLRSSIQALGNDPEVIKAVVLC